MYNECNTQTCLLVSIVTCENRWLLIRWEHWGQWWHIHSWWFYCGWWWGALTLILTVIKRHGELSDFRGFKP